MLRIHPAARKHGIADLDIEHAVKHAIAIDDLGDWKRLYLGPGRNAALLEVVSLVQGKISQVVIHAMKMRSRYRNIILGGR
jgi:hypothetical protein